MRPKQEDVGEVLVWISGLIGSLGVAVRPRLHLGVESRAAFDLVAALPGSLISLRAWRPRPAIDRGPYTILHAVAVMAGNVTVEGAYSRPSTVEEMLMLDGVAGDRPARVADLSAEEWAERGRRA